MTPRLALIAPLVLLAGCSWFRAKPPEIVHVTAPYECPNAPQVTGPALNWADGLFTVEDGRFCFADGEAYNTMSANWQDMRRYAADLRAERDYYIDCITSSQEQTP